MIKATYRNLAVKLLDTYEAGEEVYSVVRALEGKLFLEWGRWPVKTEYATVLQDVNDAFFSGNIGSLIDD